MHIYELDGELYPSITTVLKIISVNDELLRWANHMGFRHKDIKKIQDESTEFGTKVHSHLQAIVDPKFKNPIPYKDKLEEYEIEKIKKNFINYFNDIQYITIYTEKTIISKELGYAGTLDWLTFINDGIIALMDFKTSKKPYLSMFLQLGGYYNLLKSIDQDIDIASIIIINERGCAMHPIHKNDLIEYAKLFQLLFDFYSVYKKTTLKIDYDIIKRLKQTSNSNILCK